MANVLLDSVTHTLSAALLPVDSYNRSGDIKGDIKVSLVGSDVEPRYHEDGYFLFVDLPDGDYEVQVESEFYTLQETVNFNTIGLDLLNERIDLVLTPDPGYPFEDGAIYVQGIVKDENGVPVSGVRVGSIDPEQYVLSDAEGRFVFAITEPGLEAWDMVLDVSCLTYESFSETVTMTPGQVTDFNPVMSLLGAGVALLDGKVMDSVQNTPLAYAQVDAPDYGVSAVTDLGGRYTLNVTIVETSVDVTLNTSAEGYAPVSQTVQAIKGDTVPVATDITPAPGANTAVLDVHVHSGATDISYALLNMLSISRTAYTFDGGRVKLYFEVTETVNLDIDVTRTNYVPQTVSVELVPGGPETIMDVDMVAT